MSRLWNKSPTANSEVAWASVADRFLRIHRDDRGTLSIVSVFTLLLLTVLLVMLVNVGTHVDDKLKMQNAADAATYSGGVVLARGMNGLAFSNHLLCDVFAMTAFLRESRDRHVEPYAPEILAAWRQVGEVLQTAQFEKFRRLGAAIVDKVPKEQEAVTAFSELTAGASRLTLPVFEQILQERLIGRFQRDLIQTLPDVAHAVTNEVARRHGLLGRSANEGQWSRQVEYEEQRGRQFGVLWRTNVMPVALADEVTPEKRTLPVVDPDPQELDYPQLQAAEEYLQQALEQRRNLSKRYLTDWNFDRLALFRENAKMSMFFNLWRIATCDQLERLLNREYPLTNLPMVLRRTETGADVEQLINQAEAPMPGVRLSIRNDGQYESVMSNLRQLMNVSEYMDRNFHFVGVVYRPHRRETGPGLFRNPLHLQSDAQTFSQIMLFVPRPRKFLIDLGQAGSGGSGQQVSSLGGTYGYSANLEVQPQATRPGRSGNPLLERWVLENWPTHWDLLNQNWMVQLVPATTKTLPQILGTNPGGDLAAIRLPDYSGVESRHLKQISNH